MSVSSTRNAPQADNPRLDLNRTGSETGIETDDKMNIDPNLKSVDSDTAVGDSSIGVSHMQHASLDNSNETRDTGHDREQENSTNDDEERQQYGTESGLGHQAETGNTKNGSSVTEGFSGEDADADANGTVDGSDAKAGNHTIGDAQSGDANHQLPNGTVESLSSDSISKDLSADKQVLYSNLKDLTEIISNVISEINQIVPEVVKKNNSLNSYSKFLSKSKTFESYSDFLQRFDDPSGSTMQELNDSTSNSSNLALADNIQFNIESDLSNLSVADRNAKLMSLLPLMPGTRIPEIDLNAQAKTVQDIWNEWTIGHKNKPPLQDLEKKFGTRWRRGRIAKSAQRRKKVIEFVESEFKRHENVLKNIEVVVNDLDNYRISKGKGLFWLYGALPDRLYDDSGSPLFELPKPKKHNLDEEDEGKDENKGDSKDSGDDLPAVKKLKKSLDQANDVPVDEENTNITAATTGDSNSHDNDNANEEHSTDGRGILKDGDQNNDVSSNVDDNNIDDDLKAVDSNSKGNEGKFFDEASENNSDNVKLPVSDERDRTLVRDDEKSSKPEMEIESSAASLSNVNADQSEGDREVEDEEEDEDEDDEDDVNMPSVADVAAMAAMSVEGEDDEHALVDSAALAVAAQHVAAQQRKRDQAQKSNNSEDTDINHYISTEDNLNDNTDPALSKL